MDAETQAKFDQFAEKNWGHGPCPVCATNKWVQGGDIAEMSVSDMFGTDFTAASAVYPMLPIFCENCGYTLLFNTSIAFAQSHDAPSEADETDDAVGQGQAE